MTGMENEASRDLRHELNDARLKVHQLTRVKTRMKAELKRARENEQRLQKLLIGGHEKVMAGKVHPLDVIEDLIAVFPTALPSTSKHQPQSKRG